MYKDNFRERIIKARHDAGYSQQQVADLLNISQSKIAKIESGRQEPDLETIGILAEFYCISVDWLFGLGQKEPLKPANHKLGDKINASMSLISFLAQLSFADKKVFLSGNMKFSQFTESEQFRNLTPEQQMYIYQEYQSQKWEQENDPSGHLLQDAEPQQNIG